MTLNDGTGEWIYPSSESVLEDAGLFEIEVYIQRRRECLELETDVENSEYIYWWKPFNLANVVNT